VKDEELVDQIERNHQQAKLTAETKALLDYAAKLTLRPGEMQENDVAALRAAGYTDRAILDAAQIVAYYAYVNRIASGLGVGLEDYWRKA